VRVDFAVPDAPPGRYAIMVCNLGCREPLADLVPVRMTLVDSPQALALSRRLDRLKEHFATKLRRANRRQYAWTIDVTR
jgi:hypothetical protein